MKTTSITFAAVATFALAFTSASQAAVFAKFDGIDGESTRVSAQQIQSANTRGTQGASTYGADKIQSNTSPSAALLLPAVQAAREAARRSSSAPAAKGNVEYSWKIEKGEK